MIVFWNTGLREEKVIASGILFDDRYNFTRRINSVLYIHCGNYVCVRYRICLLDIIKYWLKWRSFHTPLKLGSAVVTSPSQGVWLWWWPRCYFAAAFGARKVEWCGHQVVKRLRQRSAVSTANERNAHADEQNWYTAYSVTLQSCAV